MSVQLVPRALRYVEEVARQGSIQAASRELGIAASAIDRQIILLEEELGAPLFERQPNGMRPTHVGGLVIALARRWKTDAGGLFTTVRNMKGIDIGTVRLVAMDSHANGLMPDLVSHLAASHAGVSLDIEIVSPDQSVEMLLEDRAEVGAIFNLRAQRDVHVLWSADLPLGCVTSRDHPLASCASVTLKTASEYPLATQNRSLAIRRYFEDRHSWLFSERPPPVATNSLQLVKCLALTGNYVAITSELDMAPEIIAGDLVFVPISDAIARPQTISIAISSRRALPRIARIVAEKLIERVEASLVMVRAKSRGSMLPSAQS